MATDFPTSKQTFTNPTSANNLDSPSHAGQHADINDTVEAIQDKLGTAAQDNAPAANKFLRGTGANTSEWDIDFVDEDDMFSDSATAVPSQQSVKAYADDNFTPNDGWIPSGEAWTYASAMTFTVSGDQTSKYTKGTKIKLTNSTTKYFYVVSSSYSDPNTTVIVTGETDLADAAITAPYYSYADCPQGFKRGEDWFNCVGTLGADQTISDSTATTLDFEATTDTNSNFNNTTNKYTCPVSGMYIVQMSIREGSGSPDWTRALTYIYAPTAILGNDIQATEVRGITHCELVRCDKGDEIYCRLLVDADSGNPIVGSNSSFAISFIGL